MMVILLDIMEYFVPFIASEITPYNNYILDKAKLRQEESHLKPFDDTFL